MPATVKSYRELREEGFKEEDAATNNDDDDDANVGEGEEECDLDCKMRKLYENYFVELEGLMDLELCIDSGKDTCWDALH